MIGIDCDSIRGFAGKRMDLARMLLASSRIHTGSWQAKDTSRSSLYETYELMDVALFYRPPAGSYALARALTGTTVSVSGEESTIGPDLPWAENHFQERISGDPLNPPPSHVDWPWGQNSNRDFQNHGKFSHTYPERMWPKHAYANSWPDNAIDTSFPMRGVRYEYGDLDDLLTLLNRQPLTRQAYLPIWFPEDTGAVSGQRVPCTLGYHFMIRGGELSCRYYIRSCDMIRHFTNDVYLTCRLMQHVTDHLRNRGMDLQIGQLTMFISSLHAHLGDITYLQRMAA